MISSHKSFFSWTSCSLLHAVYSPVFVIIKKFTCFITYISLTSKNGNHMHQSLFDTDTRLYIICALE